MSPEQKVLKKMNDDYDQHSANSSKEENKTINRVPRTSQSIYDSLLDPLDLVGFQFLNIKLIA